MAARVFALCVGLAALAAQGNAQTSAPTSAPTSEPDATPAPATPAPATPAPATPAPATPAPATPAPATPSPAAEPVTVVVTFLVEGVDHAALIADAAMMTSFKEKCAQATAASAGVNETDVVITLTAGSVNVEAEITPPSGTTAAGLASTLQAADSAAADLVTALLTVSGLDGITTGDLAVTDMAVALDDPSADPNATTTAAGDGAATASGAVGTCTVQMGAMAAMISAMYFALGA